MKLIIEVSEPWEYLTAKGDLSFEVDKIMEFYEDKWYILIEAHEPNAPKYMILSQRHQIRDGHWNINAVTKEIQSYITTKDLSPFITVKNNFIQPRIGTLYVKDSAILPRLEDLSSGEIVYGESAQFIYEDNKVDYFVSLLYKLIIEESMIFLASMSTVKKVVYLVQKNELNQKYDIYETNVIKKNIKSLYDENKNIKKIKRYKYLKDGKLKLITKYTETY